jgi:hypothetical protein
MGGTTWLFNDGQCESGVYCRIPVAPPDASVIDHYYHFSAELLLGAWRAYAMLDPDITPTGKTSLPPPRRAWFLHQNLTDW